MSRKFEKEKFYDFIVNHGIVKFSEKPIKLKSGRLSNWYVNWRTAANDVYLIDELTDYLLAFTREYNISPDCFYGVPEGATKFGIIAQYKYNPKGVILSEKEKLVALSLPKINKISEEILKNIHEEIDCVYGDPASVCREIAIITQYNLVKRAQNYRKDLRFLPMGRRKPKSHGLARDKYFVGEPFGKTLVLLDNKEREKEIREQLRALENVKIREIIEIRKQLMSDEFPERVAIIEDVTTTGSSLLETIEKLGKNNITITAAIGLTNRNELRDNGKPVEEILEEKGVAYYAMSNALDLLPIAYRKQKPGEEIKKLVEEYFKKYGTEDIKLAERE